MASMMVACPKCGESVTCDFTLRLGPSEPAEGGGLYFPVTVDSITGFEEHAATHL